MAPMKRLGPKYRIRARSGSGRVETLSHHNGRWQALQAADRAVAGGYSVVYLQVRDDMHGDTYTTERTLRRTK